MDEPTTSHEGRHFSLYASLAALSVHLQDLDVFGSTREPETIEQRTCRVCSDRQPPRYVHHAASRGA
jgi:hypothetical protein